MRTAATAIDIRRAPAFLAGADGLLVGASGRLRFRVHKRPHLSNLRGRPKKMPVK